MDPTRAPSDATSSSAETSLHLVRSRFMDRILDQSSQPFVISDFDGNLIHTNRAFQELVGYSAVELSAMSYNSLTPPRYKGTSETYLARLSQTGKAQRYEKAYLHREGHEIPIEVVVDLYRDEQGGPTGYYAFITDITERKNREALLLEEESRFRRLYDEAPFGYHEIDPNGTILMVNRTECEMLGYSREEMIGRPIFDFVHPAQRETARKAVRDRSQGSRAVMSVERTYLTKGGQPITVAIENRLTRDETGRVVSIRSTVQDITWRKQAEAALITSERRARALFEGIEDAVFVHDLSGQILDANPAACRRLGYTREELLKLKTSDIDDPTFGEGFEDRLAQQLRDGHLRIEGRHRTKAGRAVPVDINTSTIQLEDQTVVLAVIRDITERKALEETRRQFAEAQLKNSWEMEAKNRQLSQSEARYRQLTEGCLDAIVVTDQKGRITLFNLAAESTFGYQSKDILEHQISELFVPEEGQNVAAALEAYLRTRCGDFVGQTVEVEGRRQSGEKFPLEMSISSIETGSQIQFMVAIRDQGERQRMRAIIMQSERLASIGVLSAGVAHEINNPLAYIANNLAVLERDLVGVVDMIATYESSHELLGTSAPEILERIAHISDDLDWPYVRENLGRLIGRTRDGVQRVANIVAKLRNIASTSPTKFEPVLVSELVAGAIEMVQGRIRRAGINLEVHHGVTTKLPCVPSQIDQVILNLLVNAIQAVEAVAREEGRKIEISTRESPTEQIIAVADNGVGIKPEHIPHLFDPFFTTKPVGEGTGLGLSICHGLVEGHGGRIEVQSVPDRGTTFRVVIPFAHAGRESTARIRPAPG